MLKHKMCFEKWAYKCLIAAIFSISFILFAHYNANAAITVDLRGNPNSDTRVVLDWTSVPNAASYFVYRDGVKITPTGIIVNDVLDPLTHTDPGRTPDTRYKYEVFAYAGTDESSGLLDSGTVWIVTSQISAPADFKGKYNVNSGLISFTWTNVSSWPTSHIIIMNETSGNTVPTISETATSCVVSDASIVAGTNLYSIKVSDDLGHISQPGLFPIYPITVPAISASLTDNTMTFHWAFFAQYSDFVLQKSPWLGSFWDNSWSDVNAAVTPTGATDTIPSTSTFRYRLAARPASNYYTGYSNVVSTIDMPRAPAYFNCEIESPGVIHLSWTSNPENKFDYQIYRKINNGEYVRILTRPYYDYTGTDLVNMTAGDSYTYYISVSDSLGNVSRTNPVTVTTSVPVAPTRVNAIITSASSIALNWTDTNTSELGYKIERSDVSSGGDFTQIGVTAANAVSYEDSGLVTGRTYTYRVRAFSNLGNSPYSNEVSVTMSESVIPLTLKAIIVSSSRVDLTWTYPGSGSYRTAIERKTGLSGTWTQIYTTAAGALKYSDTGLLSNTQYFYRVRNYLGIGIMTMPYPSGNTGVEAVTMLGGLRLTGRADSDNTIHLSWSGNSAGGDVTVERKMANGSFAVLATVGPGSDSWNDDTGLVPGAAYIYRVKVKTATNESIYSNEATVSNYYLEAPSDLTASANPTAGIDLGWKDNSSDETGFEIWRQVENVDDFTLYATVDKNVTKFTDKNTSKGVEYYYQVRAYTDDPEMYSDFTDTAGRGAGVIVAPSNLKFTYDSNTEGVLSWKDNSSNERGFEVELKIGEDGEWREEAWVSANETSYEVDGLNEYNIYYFRVRAYSKSSDFDALSEELAVSMAAPATPTDITATAISANQINVKWTDNADNESGYRIMRTTATLGYYSVVGEVDANVTSYTDRGLYSGVTYTYRVVAFNGSSSAESGEATATTGKKVTFTDISAYAWARDGIENLASRGVIKGKEANRFMPGDTLTKAEFVSMMLRAFKLETTPVGSFADVKTGKWYYKDVMTAAYFGIISVDASNKFYPEKPITREEIALIIAKTLEVAGKPLDGYENSVLEKFNDKDQISPYAVASMASLVGEGVLTGVSGNSIAPRNTATRAEAAVFIYRIIDR